VLVLLDCAQTNEALESALRSNAGPAPRAGGSGAELRLYGIGAQILSDLGVGRMRLMAVPRKIPSVAGFGLDVVGYLDHPSRQG
jgi:3,4-dihydroxy 2-butanone 4-phosphate synthase/GTP cyclohydrolase II